jgi:ribosome-interacting GTPase 1
LPFEDVAFQLIDLPPLSNERMEPWVVDLLKATDALWLVIDLSDPACADQVQSIRAAFARRNITLSAQWPGIEGRLGASQPALDSESALDPFGAQLPTLLVANKSDLDPDPDEVQVLEELTGVRFPAKAISAATGAGIEELAPFLFHALAVVRVYTKAPGKPLERTRPFTVRRGATVLDVARLVHHDFASKLKFARLWGSGAFEGQHVGPEHRVADRDIVELHTG